MRRSLLFLGLVVVGFAYMRGYESLSVCAAALLVWYILVGVNVVKQWDRRPVLRFGKYIRTLEPGLSWVDPLIHSVLDDVFVKDNVIALPSGSTVTTTDEDGDEVETTEDRYVTVQTADNVGLGLGAVLTFQIVDVQKSVVNVDDVNAAVLQRALSTLGDFAGRTSLEGILLERDTFCSSITTELGKRVSDWGVMIKAFELPTFVISDAKTAEAISLKARATMEAAAELARAEVQVKVAEALNAAAKTYTPEGRWLKGVEVLVELTRSGENNTILIPTDLTNGLEVISKTLGNLKPAA